MEIVYKNRDLKQLCKNFTAASKKYGDKMANIIQIRMKYIKSARCVEELLHLRIGRCHTIKEQRMGQYAMDLVHPYRLIFEKMGDVTQIARIVQIVDYY